MATVAPVAVMAGVAPVTVTPKVDERPLGPLLTSCEVATSTAKRVADAPTPLSGMVMMASMLTEPPVFARSSREQEGAMHLVAVAIDAVSAAR